MLLVDSGLAEHMAIAEETEKAYASTIAGTVGSENERIAKAVAASSLARHDKLLTEVARRAVESGSRLAQVTTANMRGDEFIRRSPALGQC